VKKLNIEIPEIGLDNMMDFSKIFGFGIKEKVPFELVGYDGELNMEWADENFRQNYEERETDMQFETRKELYGK